MKFKYFFFILLLGMEVFPCSGQKMNWQNLDLVKDSVFGISTEKAYAELLAGKKAKTVIVAVIDGGIDTTHEDLRSILWTSPVDGSHGRNYLSSEIGKEDVTMMAQEDKGFYDSLSYSAVPKIYQVSYQNYRKVLAAYAQHVQGMETFCVQLNQAKRILDNIIGKIGKENPTLDDFKQYKPVGEEGRILDLVEKKLSDYPDFKELKAREVDGLISVAQFHLSHGLSTTNGEDEATKSDDGNSDISPDPLGLFDSPNPAPYHGTHVSGIIGAVRNNGKGINGVADHVQIMTLKVLSNIREMRDKNLAKAIRFAVDNGATIINMSLGKYYSYDRRDVELAIKYAMSRDVLFIHGAGNDGRNLDENNVFFYPERHYRDGGEAGAWINVGASGYRDDSALAADFSNYGERNVDVFAPGVNIHSCLPYSKYTTWSGTSMAAPVVAGLAALIREYYPKLTAVQIKNIIMKSIIKRPVLADKCVSGGVVNAYNAIKLAQTYR